MLMSRPLRIEYPGAFYHVINRGHRQEAIVSDQRDKERFISQVSRMSRQFNVLVHSYCLMTNHYHLIIETPEGNLSRAIQWLNVSYAAYFNRRHDYTGHLFQGRFKSVLVEAGEYLEALSRYIHLNPVRAGVASCAWAYAWSSCRYFVGSEIPPGWLEVNRILAGFGRKRTAARLRYTAYLSEATQANPLDDLVGGSLLGSKSFIDWIGETFLSTEKVDREIPQLKELKPHPDVETIVEEVAKQFHVSTKRILTSGHKRNMERDVAIYLSRELSGMSCQALGRHFGGISGAGVTMRFNRIESFMRKDHKLTKSIKLLYDKLINS
jgi:putative transposase